MRFPPWGDVMGMVDGNGNLLYTMVYEGYGAGYYFFRWFCCGNDAARHQSPGLPWLCHGRFVSADGLRQVRMGDADLLGLHGGGPHINFNILYPHYVNVHVFI